MTIELQRTGNPLLLRPQRGVARSWAHERPVVAALKRARIARQPRGLEVATVVLDENRVVVEALAVTTSCRREDYVIFDLS